MPHLASLRLASVVTCAVALAAPAPASADEPTTDYVVQGGETCMEIAVRVLGDRRLLPELHRLNPQLGPLPHQLVAGQILKVPKVEDHPDARLTGKSGDVRVRRPSEPAWDAARRGMDLFRAWRVGAEERASAEVTFIDTQRLYLRENTVVVIYGPERRRARIDAPEAVLERGALRSRLGELSGKRLKVVTPSSESELGRGSALVAVDPAGLSTVANHDGDAVAVRGKAGGKVAVASGMGTRIAVGKPPERPRPLPPAPRWMTPGPLGFLAVGDGATVDAAWAPEPKAASYRIELARGDAVVAAVELPASVTRFELHGAPPGRYQARIASLDRDRLESKPGPALEIVVRGLAIAAPGAATAPLPAALADDAPIAPTAAPAPLLVARGARLTTDGLACATAGGDAAAELVLTDVGPTAVTCVDGGQAFAPLALEVVGVEVAPRSGTVELEAGATVEVALALTSNAPLGSTWQVEASPGITATLSVASPGEVIATVRAAADAPASGSIRVIDPATQRALGEVAISIRQPAPTEVPEAPPPPAAAPRRPIATAGISVGAVLLSTDAVGGNELGNPALDGDIVASGAAVTARAAWWFRPALFAEAELAVVPTSLVDRDDSALVLGGHAYLGVRLLERPRGELRVLVGGGGFALPSPPRDLERDLDPDVAWGVTAAVAADRAVTLRVDGRQHIGADRSGGVASTWTVGFGLEFGLGRAR